jgi:anti-sigma factor RsiW
MKINRNNYEEYFLLYVDDELNAQQKQEVEAFVKENTDLVAELEMFKSTKLPPFEAIVFDKSFLFRNEASNINLTNYKEFFLLAVDNELDEKEKDELKIFVEQHPELNEELTLLHQVVLPIEKIEFPDKSILYRSEKERRVVPFGWLRVSVAAALIGLAVFIWSIIPSQKQQQVAVANKNIIQPKKENNVAVAPQIKINADNKIPEKNNLAATADKNNKTIKQQNSKTISNQPIDNKNEAAKENDNEINSNNSIAQNPSNTTQQQVAKVSNNLPQRETNVEQQQIAPQNVQPVTTTDAQNVYAANTQNSNNNIAQPAVYRELNTSDADNNSLYLGSVEINKNKVRGFLKKASRIFGGKAKGNDDAKDIKVANLDINAQNL